MIDIPPSPDDKLIITREALDNLLGWMDDALQTRAILNDLIEYLSYQWKHSDYNDWYVEVALKETEEKLKGLQ